MNIDISTVKPSRTLSYGRAGHWLIGQHAGETRFEIRDILGNVFALGPGKYFVEKYSEAFEAHKKIQEQHPGLDLYIVKISTEVKVMLKIAE